MKKHPTAGNFKKIAKRALLSKESAYNIIVAQSWARSPGPVLSRSAGANRRYKMIAQKYLDQGLREKRNAFPRETTTLDAILAVLHTCKNGFRFKLGDMEIERSFDEAQSVRDYDGDYRSADYPIVLVSGPEDQIERLEWLICEHSEDYSCEVVEEVKWLYAKLQIWDRHDQQLAVEEVER